LFRNPTISLGRIRNKWEKTKDREQWRMVVEEAMAHPGL
jgi:hypothetical protein